MSRNVGNLLILSGMLGLSLLAGCGGVEHNETSVVSNDSQGNDSDSTTGDNSNDATTNGSNANSSFDTGVLGDAKLPSDFPSEVPLAEYMVCQSVTRVRDDFMITFHAKDISLTEVVDWFKAELPKNGWKADPDLVNETSAILPFKKGDRSCGISITNFVLDASAQKDESTRGITIQTPARES